MPKPRRTFLEMDELAALLAGRRGAGRARPSSRSRPIGRHRTRDRVAVPGRRRHAAERDRRRARPRQVDGHASTCASSGSRTPSPTPAGARSSRRSAAAACASASCATCGSATSRLHDPDGARFHIPDAKTEAGIREVQMTPDLVDVLDRAPRPRAARRLPDRPGRAPVPEPPRRAHDAPARRRDPPRGGRRSPPSGSKREGRPPLPTTTPHTMRRTYISIALLANNFDVKWVMSQVGHADSKMTMDVYAQLEQRVDRSHGTAFDELVRRARGQEPDDVRDTFGTPDPADTPDRAPRHRHTRQRKSLQTQAFQRWRDPDSNRGHHDFQSCALPTELSRRGPEG